MKNYIANWITLCRILCSILLLFFPALSPRFYITYLLCGISDMVDGAVARKTHTASGFGAGFDTAADFIFVAAASIKLLPLLQIPKWLWAWTAVIAVIKLSNMVRGLLCRKPFLSPHTFMNKITGLLLFLLPLTLPFIALKYTSPMVCFMATYSAVQEGLIMRAEHQIV